MLDEAIQVYHIALRLKPNYAEAYNNLGVAYEARGLLDEAIKQYQISLQLNPKNESAKDNLVKVLQKKK